MTPDEALRDIKGYAGANRITYSGHARDQMRARGAQREDVHHALSNATSCKLSDDSTAEVERWVANGKDLDGDVLRPVVIIKDGLLVVTVMGEQT